MIKRSDLINTSIFVWMFIVAVLNCEFTNRFVLVCDIASAILFLSMCIYTVKVAWQESKLMSVLTFVFPIGYIMVAYWQIINL